MTTVAKLDVLLGADVSGLSTGLNKADKQVKGWASKTGDSLIGLGGKVTLFTAPLAAGLAAAIASSTAFDQAMTNTAAVLGKSRDEMQDLNAEILDIGGDSLAGPQAAAEAFYDVVGGISNASNHIPIFNAAIATAEAGSANLSATTAALISVMNGYSFSAEQAGFASDVMTQIVAKGVGTMDELATALPKVSGLAASVGVDFDQLGGMMALITTKGYSFSEAGTQIQAMITALIKPNEDMKKGLQEIGFESGEAAIQALGLVGVYDALADTTVAGKEGMAKLTGSVEALNGVIAVTSPGSEEFLTNFTTGIEGATQAAQEIQRNSPAAAFQLIQSKAQELSITIGNVLTPVLQDVAEGITPIIDNVINWVNANPELASGIIKVAGGVTLLGPAIAGLGVVIKGIAIFLSPLGLLVTLLGSIAAVTDWEQVNTGVDQLGIGIQNLTSGNVGDGLTGIKDGLSSIFDATIVTAADTIIGQLEKLTGIQMPDVATGFDAWGQAFRDGWYALEIIVDRITRGLDLFVLDVKLKIFDFVAGIRQTILDASASLPGGPIDIAPSLELAQTDAWNLRANYDVADGIEKILRDEIAAGGPIDLGIGYANDISVNGAAIADALSITGVDAVKDAVSAALTSGDTAGLTQIMPLALELDIQDEALRTQVQDKLKAAIQSGDTVTTDLLLPLAIDLGIDTDTLIATATDAITDQTPAVQIPIEPVVVEGFDFTNQVYQETGPVQLPVEPVVLEGYNFDMSNVTTTAPTFDFSNDSLVIPGNITPDLQVDTTSAEFTVRQQLIEAFAIEDQYTIDLLTPTAVALGIDVEGVKAQAQEQVTFAIQQADYTATVTANVYVQAAVQFIGSVGQAITDTVNAAAAGIAATVTAPTGSVPGAAGGAQILSEGLLYVHDDERVLTATETAAYNAAQIAPPPSASSGSSSSGGRGGDVYNIASYGDSSYQLLQLIKRERAHAAL